MNQIVVWHLDCYADQHLGNDQEDNTLDNTLVDAAVDAGILVFDLGLVRRQELFARA